MNFNSPIIKEKFVVIELFQMVKNSLLVDTSNELRNKNKRIIYVLSIYATKNVQQSLVLKYKKTNRF